MTRRDIEETALATDYGRWPAVVRELAVAPLSERTVSSEELVAFCRRGTGTRPLWMVPDLHVPVFPKIATVSWKCLPWLLPATAGLNLGNHCSDRMRTVLSNWIASGTEAVLRFFPVVDYSDVAEFRFTLTLQLRS